MATKVSTDKIHGLFLVLNWGLGHAGRTAAIVDVCLSRNWTCTIFTNGQALRFLQERYGDEVRFIKAADFNAQYKSSSFCNLLHLACALGQAKIKDDKKLRRLLQASSYHFMINDCRMVGVKSNFPKSILLNHQLQVPWPWFKKGFAKFFIRWMRSYESVWIPDFENNLLSGSLSNAKDLEHVRFVGPLNRWQDFEQHNALENVLEKNGSLVFFGIEPSDIEATEMKHLSQVFKEIVFLSKSAADQNDHFLASILLKASCIVSYPGYSSIMELYACSATLILIDKPWHLEQHILFKHHQSMMLFTCLANLDASKILAVHDMGSNKKKRFTSKNLLTLAIDSLT